MRRDLLHVSKRMSSKAVDGEDTGHLSDEELSLLQESLGYWDDAVKECLNEQYSGTNSKKVTLLYHQQSTSFFIYFCFKLLE